MAITAVNWHLGGGHDIHVLAGKTSRELQSLVAIHTTGDGWTRGNNPPANVNVRFIGEFDGQPHKHGVFVDPQLGTVKVDSPRPDVRLHNFLIRAEVFEGTTMFATTPRIRVHVHDKLAGSKVWLAPKHLTVRAGASPQSFTVLAQFDDGVIGNITHLPDLAWSPPTLNGVNVHPQTGAVTGTTVGGNATVTVKLPSDWGNLTASAEVSTELSWAALGAVTQATWISGPGPGAAGYAPNLLFLPEGFVDSEKTTTFLDRAHKALKALRTNLSTSPFNLLGDALNVWLAWLPSQQKGATVAHELSLAKRDSKTRASELPLARAPEPPPPPPAPAPPWTAMEEILHEVGLPVLEHAIDEDAGDLILGARYLAQMLSWRTLYGTKIDGRISFDNYKSWASMADRRMARDRDTALGVAFGAAPNHEDAEVSRGLGFHPLRAKRTDLDAFLGALKDDKGFQIGALAWGVAGKDRQLVYALVSAVRYGGMETGELISASLNNDTEFPFVPVGGAPADSRAIDLADPVLPRSPPIETTSLLAHEAAHAFTLQDEYGYSGRSTAAQAITAAAAPNIQDRDTLLSTPPPPFAPALDGSKLKWQWPRMRKVAITTGVASPVPPFTNKFTVPHEPFAAGVVGFVDGEIVQLRARALSPGVARSDTWTVSVGGVTPNALTIERNEPITPGLEPPTFAKGSLVYAPHLDSMVMNAVKPLTLVHDKIRDHITTTGQPLNAPQGAPASRDCSVGGETPEVQEATNWPNALTMPKGAYRAWAVGAHEGGAQYQCGVYHPTGACMMRARIYYEHIINIYLFSNWPADTTYEPHPITLCAVCRYALVDLLDPTKHGFVDAWLDTRYPR